MGQILKFVKIRRELIILKFIIMADHLIKLNHPLHFNAIKQGSSFYWLPASTLTADAKIGYIGVNEHQEIVFVPKVSDLKAAFKDKNTRTGSI